ncbi:MarR family transcriptional regulator [Nocardioides sp. MJB4]|uniref:MarR family transcriptional regulator n=1 Tax=Nocardioides donggukensis TaxID=2774019 RepID=A0A927K3Z0_9ACTN|nr:MarR family transcriptional regulator [Nocardioides donggukensis]
MPAGSLETSTLLALRELIHTGSLVAPAIARRASLSRSELRALELLFDGPLGPVDLARELGVTSAASSGIVDRLVAREHVVRRPHDTDRRRTVVTITDTGRSDVMGHLTPMFLALHELDADLDDEERATVERYLRGAIEALRRLV